MARRHAIPSELGGYERGFSGRTMGAYTGPLAAAPLGAEPILEALIQASPNNAGTVQLGFGVSGNTPIEMLPGETITVPVSRLNLLRVVLGAGDYINWIAFTV